MKTDIHGKEDESNNMIELISLHIPKTGGRSLRRVLKNVYGDTLDLRQEIHDFYPDVKTSPPLEDDFPDHTRAIHAHLSIRHFMPIIQAHNPKVITWIREPVERMISNYYFFIKWNQLVDQRRWARKFNYRRWNKS